MRLRQRAVIVMQWTGIFLWVLLSSAHAAGPLQVKTRNLELRFSESGAQLIQWLACLQGCDRKENPAYRFDFASLQPPLTLITCDHEWSDAIHKARYRLMRAESERWLELTFVSEPLMGDIYLQKRYRIAKQGFEILLDAAWLNGEREPIQAPADLELILQQPGGMALEKTYGFAGIYERLRIVGNGSGAFVTLGTEDLPRQLPARCWAGLRGRFWTMLVSSSSVGNLTSNLADKMTAPLWLRFSNAGPASWRVYAGPIDYSHLRYVESQLTGLMFSSLWFWLRWLCFGLLFILDGLYLVLGNWGIAVMVLSLVVKILMTPLSRIANRWRADVNRIQSRLQPEIDAIKRQYRGEEQTRRILALHKEQGVHLLYTSKNLLGVLIQIPVFIAAFEMLNETIWLSGISFLWVVDMAKPDHVAALPWTIPFLGEHLNLMPVLMTLATFLASWQFDDPSLSIQLRRKQQRNLYLMALLFFVLFYTFPAGMVLYWTTNNLLQYLKDRLVRWRKARMDAARAG